MQSTRLLSRRVAPTRCNIRSTLRRRQMSLKPSPKLEKGSRSNPAALEYSPATKRPPTEPTAPPAQPKPMSRARKIPLVLASGTVFLISAYIAYVIAADKRIIAEGNVEPVPEDASERYNDLAPTYDKSLDMMERVGGIKSLRKKIAKEASGDVCEVSIGTGRNLDYYDWNFPGYNGVGKPGEGQTVKQGKVKSFTAVDKSSEMLEVAHEKFSKLFPGIIGIKWVLQDASKPLPMPSVVVNGKNGTKKFDTIIQTMGLCSTGDPVGLLKNLGNSVEPNGRILLLEHGKGTWDIVNRRLDRLAARNARNFGCIWNKDLGAIIEESGLEVVKIDRKQMGTVWWIELRPKPIPVEDLSVSQSTLSEPISSNSTRGWKSIWPWSS